MPLVSTPTSGGNVDSELHLQPSPACTLTCFGVPAGCVVRNTFIEWQESDCDSSGPQRVRTPLAPGLRRVRSCPPESIAATLNFLEDGESTICRTLSCTTSPQHRDMDPHSEGIRLNAKGTSRSLGDLPDAETPQHLSVTKSRDVGSQGSGQQIGYGLNSVKLPTGGVPGHFKPYEKESEESMCHDEGHSPQTSSGRSPMSFIESRSTQRASRNRPSQWSSLVLRGLPFNITEADIAAFIEQHGVSGDLAPGRPISLMTTPQGKSSGFAEVQLNMHANYPEIEQKLHMQCIGERYIEVLPPQARGKFGSWKPPTSRRDPRRYDRSKPGSWFSSM